MEESTTQEWGNLRVWFVPILILIILLLAINVLGYLEIWYFKDVLNVVRSYINILYLVSGVLLLVGVVFAYKQLITMKNQLELMKDDIKVKNARAAIEKSVEYLDLFASSILPKINKLNNEIKEKQIELNKISWNPKKSGYKLDIFTLPDDIQKQLIPYLLERHNLELVNIFNELEMFSAGIIHCIADEEVVYYPIAKVYKELIDEDMIFFCHIRNGGAPFKNIVALYSKWSDRLLNDRQQEIIEKRKRELEMLELGLSETSASSHPIKPLGV